MSENSPPPIKPPEVPPKAPNTPKNINDWTMVTHLSALCVLIGVPSFVGPLVCWLIKKDEMERVDFAGKEALNFHLTMLIIELASVPLVFVFGLGFFTAIAAAVLGLVFTIVAAVAAAKGEDYVYPLSLRMIK